jgi:hypothetical protein
MLVVDQTVVGQTIMAVVVAVLVLLEPKGLIV